MTTDQTTETTDQRDGRAAAVQRLVGPAFRALADALAAQPSTIADLPSLCEGWPVRNVLAHMTMAARYDSDAFQTELAAVGYDFQTLSDSIAQRDGQLSFDQLIEGLRGDTMAQWAPPGGGAVGALTHVVIHGLDITSAIGLPRTATDAATRQVLEILTVGEVHQHFGSHTAGRELKAVDLDWTWGVGESISAEAGDLILALAGRPRPRIDLCAH